MEINRDDSRPFLNIKSFYLDTDTQIRFKDLMEHYNFILDDAFIEWLMKDLHAKLQQEMLNDPLVVEEEQLKLEI